MAALELASTPLITDGNLTQYWKLENTSATVGGVTLTNNGTTGFNAAKFNNGADMGATNSSKYLSAANDLGLTGGAFSIVFWAKVTTAPSASQQVLFEAVDAGNHLRTRIMYVESAGKTLQFLRTKLGTGDQGPTPTVDLGTAAFKHVAMTYDLTTVRGYVDGSEVGNAAASGNGSAGGTDGMTIGASATPDSYFSGIIDDAAVFTRALSAAEVLGLFNGTLTANSGFLQLI